MIIRITASKKYRKWANMVVEGDCWLDCPSGYFGNADCEYVEQLLDDRLRYDYHIPDNEPFGIKVYIEDDNSISADFSLRGCEFSVYCDDPIDLRRVRKREDLIKVLPELLTKFRQNYLECFGYDTELLEDGL